jgi:uncharacterized protein DUF7007
MRSTPWGTADYVQRIAYGISTVSTPGHGGVMVSAGVAERRLSERARERAIRWDGYYCYEEDCEWAIAARELPEVQDYFKVSTEDIMDTLYRWCPEYLGVEHDPPVVGEGEAILRTAWGTWHEKVPEGYVGFKGEDHTGATCEGIIPRRNYERMERRGEATKQAGVISLAGFKRVAIT